MNVTGKLVLCGLILCLLWTLSFPLYVDTLLCIAIVSICLRADLSAVALVFVGLITSVAVIHFLRPYLFPERPYYREHEKYAANQAYKRNVRDIIEVPHGDLAALDAEAPLSLRDPRTVHFKTDSLGFRNEADYHGQKIVLVGDSFVVGNGTDYPETLPALLRSKHNVDTYSIAYPSEPEHYYQRAEWFLDRVSSDVRFAMFFYEGNDIAVSEQALRVGLVQSNAINKALATTLNNYDSYRTRLLSNHPKLFSYSPDLFLLSRRLEREFFKREDTSVSFYEIAGRQVGFLNVQGIPTVDPAPSLPHPMPERLGRATSCVFLVPAKLRVYRKWLPSRVRSLIISPAPALSALRKQFADFDVPILDLTPVLERAAERHLASGEFIYWRDDTHWNGKGMAAVTATVAQCLTR